MAALGNQKSNIKNKKVLKFKDAPKKTRKKRKNVDKTKPVAPKCPSFSKVKSSKKELKEFTITKSQGKKVKKERTSSQKSQTLSQQNVNEEPVKLFGMGDLAGDINFTAQLKTSWEKFKIIFKKGKTKSEKSKKIGKSKKDYSNNERTTPKLLPLGTLLMLSAPRQTAKADKFPKIYRVITETWLQAGILSIVLLVIIGLMLRGLYQHMHQKQALEQKRAVIQKEIAYWQEIIRKYQDYRDGYFKLALLEYQLGNTQAVELYVEKAKTLDPNFAEADKLGSMLSSK